MRCQRADLDFAAILPHAAQLRDPANIHNSGRCRQTQFHQRHETVTTRQ
jgi:hypothetical protein